jgi:glycosyltransferase involved in cell wall biosynthesis
MPTVAVDARDALAPMPRGRGRYVSRLANALRESPAARGIELRMLEPPARERGPELLWEQVLLPRVLRREGIDAVHAPNCFLPLRRPCPGVVTVHDLAFEAHRDDFARTTGLKFRAIARRAVRSAERVVCVSEFTRREVCERYAAPEERTRVIPLAAALPDGDAEPPPGPYLLVVGDLRPRRNLPRLGAAFRRLHADGVPHRLVLAGHDDGVAAQVREAAGAAPVEITGYVPDERLDALIRGADLLVHPSLYEGFGLPLLEAMRRGTPVAAARAGALPETAGDAAILFDPHDQADMAATIRRGLEDDALRVDLIRRGGERSATYSWAVTAERTAGVYRELTEA